MVPKLRLGDLILAKVHIRRPSRAWAVMGIPKPELGNEGKKVTSPKKGAEL
jgi:hypothetical protein